VAGALQRRVAELEGADGEAVRLRGEVSRLQWLLHAAGEAEAALKTRLLNAHDEVAALSRRLHGLRAETDAGRGAEATRVQLRELCVAAARLLPPAWGVELGGSLRKGGAVVKAVAPAGAAEACGLRRGDRITSVNGRPIASKAAAVEALALCRAGERAVLGVERKGHAALGLLLCGGLGPLSVEASELVRLAAESGPGLWAAVEALRLDDALAAQSGHGRDAEEPRAGAEAPAGVAGAEE
jgi:hypothetical protein